MSVAVYVMARKRITADEYKLIEAYHALVDNCIDAPGAMKDKLITIVGSKPPDGWGEYYKISLGSLVETHVDGQGDVMYYDGMILKLSDLPADVEELRIYAS